MNERTYGQALVISGGNPFQFTTSKWNGTGERVGLLIRKPVVIIAECSYNIN